MTDMETTQKLTLFILHVGSLSDISSATAPVIGNGMSLGLTNGDVYCGLSHNTASPYHLGGAPTGYGAQIGQNCPTTNALGSQKSVGVTSDPTKSGIVASFSNITLGDIPSLQLGKLCIKY